MHDCFNFKVIYIIYRLIPNLECTSLISTENKILNTKPKIIQTWRTICLQIYNELTCGTAEFLKLKKIE